MHILARELRISTYVRVRVFWLTISILSGIFSIAQTNFTHAEGPDRTRRDETRIEGTPTPARQPLTATPKLVVGPRIPVNPVGIYRHVQVTGAVDPECDNNLIIAGARVSPNESSWQGYIYRSGDGGKSWTEALVDKSSRWVSEESCAFGLDHQAYFVTGVSDTSSYGNHHEFGQMHLYRSPDGGEAWSLLKTERFMDYTKIAIDRNAGARRGNIYIFAHNLKDGLGGDLGGKPALVTLREMPNLTFSVTTMENRKSEKFATFPSGAAVLSDGTAFAVFGAGQRIEEGQKRGQTDLWIEAVFSKDGGKTLNAPVVIRSSPKIVLLSSSLAVNPATDELFVAWIESEGEGPNSPNHILMLAKSANRGLTWKVSKMETPLGQGLDVGTGVAIARNEQGVLGVLWYGRDGLSAYLGLSYDSGPMIDKVIPLTPSKTTGSDSSAFAAIDRFLMAFATGPAPKTQKNGLEEPSPSDNIRLWLKRYLQPPYESALLVDHAGAFHPVWVELANGPTELWTRKVVLERPAKNSTYPSVAGLMDITSKVLLSVSNVRYDRLGGRVGVDISVANKTANAIDPPVLVLLAGNKTKDFSTDNADNYQASSGAIWELNIPEGVLLPNHSTPARTVMLKLLTQAPERPDSMLSVPLRVYGKIGSRTAMR
jgi:hypothetical protein